MTLALIIIVSYQHSTWSMVTVLSWKLRIVFHLDNVSRPMIRSYIGGGWPSLINCMSGLTDITSEMLNLVKVNSALPTLVVLEIPLLVFHIADEVGHAYQWMLYQIF